MSKLQSYIVTGVAIIVLVVSIVHLYIEIESYKTLHEHKISKDY